MTNFYVQKGKERLRDRDMAGRMSLNKKKEKNTNLTMEKKKKEET